MKFLLLLALLLALVNAKSENANGGKSDVTKEPSNSAEIEATEDEFEIEETEDELEDCDSSDITNYALEPIGKSTQFRIIDPCDGTFIKIKMEDLTEYDGSTDTKTKNKQTSFASTKGWYEGDGAGELLADCDGLGGDCLFNEFHAESLSKVDAELVLQTRFAVEPLEVEVGDDIVVVAAGSVKLNVEINEWPFLEETNYLVLCMGIQTNKNGVFNEEDEGRVFRLNNVQVDSLQTAQCSDGEEIDVEVTQEAQGENGVQFCYKFGVCYGDIDYDPIYTLMTGKANGFSVFVLFAAVAMSLLSV